MAGAQSEVSGNGSPREFFNETASAANSDATQSALNVLEARAAFDGVERDVFLRVGAYRDKLYLDLVDKLWRAVEIDKDGWRIVDRAPIPFRRSAGMRALPEPVQGGSIDDLRPFLNIASKDKDKDKDKDDDKDNAKDNDDSFVLAVSFVLAALPRARALSRSLRGWRTRHSEVHLHRNPAQGDRPQQRAIACPAA